MAMPLLMEETSLMCCGIHHLLATKKVVQVLLDQGADVNVWGGMYGNPSWAALVDGHEKPRSRGA